MAPRSAVYSTRRSPVLGPCPDTSVAITIRYSNSTVQANLRILEVAEVKSVPYVPLSHPFIERVIGTIRRECLDHFSFWTVRDLERKLLSFRNYYNDQRTHHALGGIAPRTKSGQTQPTVVNLDNYRWRSHFRGLYQLPVAA